MQYGGFFYYANLVQISKTPNHLSLVSMCNTASVSYYHQTMQRYATNEICIALLSNTETSFEYTIYISEFYFYHQITKSLNKEERSYMKGEKICLRGNSLVSVM